jgi:integrase
MRTGRLALNPFASVPRADAKSNPKRKRRALTEAELVKLLDTAIRRPLIEARTVRHGKNKGQPLAKVHDEVAKQLERIGRERALIYKTLVLTGLRKRELASLTIGQLHLEGRCPYLELHAADEKNRSGSQVPLRSDLAADLAQWIADLQLAHTSNPEGSARVICLPMNAAASNKLPADTPLFNVPAGLLRILDRDLKLAGIPKRDERGRTVDVHAMRHTFGTLLSKGGVAPRTAQAAMRHSTIDLTMNVYTDPKLLDVHGALDALPALPLVNKSPQPGSQADAATGTYGQRRLAPTLAPKTVESVQTRPNPDKQAVVANAANWRMNADVTSSAVKRKHPLSGTGNGCRLVERKGVEPSTSALRTQRSPN